MAAIVVDLWTDIWNPKDLAKHKMKAVCMTVLASKPVWRTAHLKKNNSRIHKLLQSSQVFLNGSENVLANKALDID
jgi:hypothetical protein